MTEFALQYWLLEVCCKNGDQASNGSQYKYCCGIITRGMLDASC